MSNTMKQSMAGATGRLLLGLVLSSFGSFDCPVLGAPTATDRDAPPELAEVGACYPVWISVK